MVIPRQEMGNLIPATINLPKRITDATEASISRFGAVDNSLFSII